MVIALGSNAVRHMIRVHVIESFLAEILIESISCRRIGVYDEFRCRRSDLVRGSHRVMMLAGMQSMKEGRRSSRHIELGFNFLRDIMKSIFRKS